MLGGIAANRFTPSRKAWPKPGAKILRAGAFKPRTSPYAFQGMGEKGLQLMREAADKFNLLTVSEVMDPRKSR